MEFHAFMGLRELVSLFFSLLDMEAEIVKGCWITEEFHVQRTVADFLWMWISAFSSVLAYVAVFLVLRGFVVVDGWRVRWAPKQESPTIPQSHTLAYKMLA
jgi:hypothetical protein